MNDTAMSSNNSVPLESSISKDKVITSWYHVMTGSFEVCHYAMSH